MAGEKEQDRQETDVRRKTIKRRQAERERKRRRQIMALRAVLSAAAVVILLLAGIRAVRYLVPSSNIRSSCTWEAGTERPLVSDFLRQKDRRASLVTDISSLTLDVPGTYTVEIQIGEKVYESSLNVVDKTAPQATTVDLTTTAGVSVSGDAFIDTVFDATDVTVSYVQEVDFETIGTSRVGILLTDAGDNTSTVYAYLTVSADGEAPVISGVSDQSVYAGETISYKTGVTVTDNVDEDVELVIDNSEVDLDTAGVYTVTYTATDSSGNTASETAEITVKEAPEGGIENIEEMRTAAQEILDSILTDDMDEEERLYTIYAYVRANVSYTGSSDKTSYVDEAIRGFTEKKGDCFTYFAVLKALMEQDGFETIDVEREGGSTHHYWSLVYFNDAWYHIDATSRAASWNASWLCFLRIDSELEEFSEAYSGYYDFDSSLYPATPTEVYNSEYIADVDIS